MKASYKFYGMTATLAVALGAVAPLSTGCGPQAYQATASAVVAQAPGTQIVPPKVDILLVEDDTGSMKEIYSQISRQLPAFLDDVNSRGWDYHFVTAPLTTLRPIRQVQASRHDSNWESMWTPAYPGAKPNGPGTVLADAFRFPQEYTDFLDSTDVDSSKEGMEPGFETIRKTLQHSTAKSTRFLRDDALLVVFVVGNGNDTSGLKICRHNSGRIDTCENLNAPLCTPGMPANAACNNGPQTFAAYRDAFKALKPNAQQIRWYSAVSPLRYTSGGCNGANTYAGKRYQQMAAELGGESYDICNVPVRSMLDSLAGNLESIKLNYRTLYLFMEERPKVGTISVIRHTRGGDVPIPESKTNGWSFEDKEVSNVVARELVVDARTTIPMSRASGWAVKLNGTARLVGDETATVKFDPYSANDAVAK